MLHLNKKIFLQYNKPGKKWKVMSQEFINQHTVEHKGKQICKYFLEGRCIKVNSQGYHKSFHLQNALLNLNLFWGVGCSFFIFHLVVIKLVLHNVIHVNTTSEFI